MLNPSVDAAVLETARGGILRAGLGFDRCDVAVVTNIGEGDHLGLADIDTLEKLARVKRTVVEALAPSGTAVLNAGDPLVVEMAAKSPAPVVFFALTTDNPAVMEHHGQPRAAGPSRSATVSSCSAKVNWKSRSCGSIACRSRTAGASPFRWRIRWPRRGAA